MSKGFKPQGDDIKLTEKRVKFDITKTSLLASLLRPAYRTSPNVRGHLRPSIRRRGPKPVCVSKTPLPFSQTAFSSSVY